MKTYSIPITWESYKRYSVEAENLEEAVKLALKQFLSEPDDAYIEASFEIDDIIDMEYPDEVFNLNKIIEEIYLKNPMRYIQQKPTDNYDNIDLVIANSEINLKHLMTIDFVQDSKGEKLLYRYFKMPVADGYAYYQITKITKKTATISICDGISLDNYRYIYFGDETTIPIKEARKFVEMRIAADEIFDLIK